MVGLNPRASARISYVPEGIFAKVKRPLASVLVLRSTPVSTDLARSVAPARRPPEGSETEPVMVAVVWANTAAALRSAQKRIAGRIINLFLITVTYCHCTVAA